MKVDRSSSMQIESELIEGEVSPDTGCSSLFDNYANSTGRFKTFDTKTMRENRVVQI